MAGPIMSILDQLSYAILHSVSPSDLVSKIAFGFRLLSFAILAPLIALGLMDVTAYVIARTLHAPKDKPRTPASVSAVPAVSSQPSRDTTDTVPSRPPSLSRGTSALSVHGRPPAHGEPAWFTFPAADEKLSGVGVFSPPITRSPSPSNDRPSIKSSLFMTRATPNASASDITPPPGWEPVNLEDVRSQEGHAAN